MNGRALVAGNLRRIRTAKGISQVQLAADAGVSRTYLNEVERELGNVTVDVLDRVAAALACEPHELLAPIAETEKRGLGLRPGRKGKAAGD